MERFKVCEKETKTKQFSKQGLAAAEEESPEEVARNEARSCIREEHHRVVRVLTTFPRNPARRTAAAGPNTPRARPRKDLC